MGAERVTFDTNILYYALDTDAGEKHRLDHDLLDRALDSNPVLLLQSLAELYNAAQGAGQSPSIVCETSSPTI